MKAGKKKKKMVNWAHSSLGNWCETLNKVVGEPIRIFVELHYGEGFNKRGCKSFLKIGSGGSFFVIVSLCWVGVKELGLNGIVGWCADKARR